MPTKIIKVRCPLCGLTVDPNRFEKAPHSLDFRLFEFFGSLKGHRGGGLRHYKVDIFKIDGGSTIFDKVKTNLDLAVGKLSKIFSPAKFSLEALINALSTAAAVPGKVAGEVTWK